VVDRTPSEIFAYKYVRFNSDAYSHGVVTVIDIGGLVLGLALTGLGVFFEWQSSQPPKRLLALSVLPPSDLDSAAFSGVGRDVRITVDGIEVTNTRTIAVTIDNRGSYDLTDEDFHKSDPLEIDVGHEISAILQSADRSAVKGEIGAGKLPLDYTGSVLRIGPGYLKRGRASNVQLLVKRPEGGHEPEPKLVPPSIIDTDVEFNSQDSSRRTLRRGRALTGTIALSVGFAVIGLVGASIAYDFITSDGEYTITPNHGPAGSSFTIRGSDYEDYAVISIESEESDDEIASTQADGDGEFELTVEVPDDLTIGHSDFTLISRDGSGSRYQYFDFAVTD
jgi:hypothetical protein